MLQHKDKIILEERLSTGILLSMVGGFLEVYTFVLRGGVFANAQTGNMMQMAMKIYQRDFISVVYFLIPIIAFFLGVFLTNCIKEIITSRTASFTLVMTMEVIALFIVGFIPLSYPHYTVNVTISFITAMQYTYFRKIKGGNCATTMCTGNLRSATEMFFKYITRKDTTQGSNSITLFLIIFSFIVGGIFSSMFIERFSIKAVWICCIILLFLLIKFIVINIVEKKNSLCI